MNREFLGVSGLRWMLAASGLTAGVIAVTGLLTRSPAIGQCLQPEASSFGHCAWCYVGMALLAAAAAPWPRLRPARARG